VIDSEQSRRLRLNTVLAVNVNQRNNSKTNACAISPVIDGLAGRSSIYNPVTRQVAPPDELLRDESVTEFSIADDLNGI